MNTSRNVISGQRRVTIGATVALSLAVLLAAAMPATAAAVPTTRPVGHHATTAPTRSTPATAPGHRMFAYYYLWWSTKHWHDLLGSNYPYGASPLPLPATLDSSGCRPTTSYAGNQLTDAPSTLWTQDDTATIDRDVRQAAAAGLAGFAVNWAGIGTTSQTVNSTTYSKRLDVLVRVVNQLRSEGSTFSLWISYKSSATLLSTTAMVNDLAFLARTYGTSPAFDRSNGGRPTLIFMGSRKYGLSTLAAVSNSARSKFYLVGDENWMTWTNVRGAYLDADQYYWSSQDPDRNPASFGQLGTLAGMVRSAAANPDGSRKAWFAPLAPGYDKQLAGGSSCVPRTSGATLRKLYAGNSATGPAAWVLISWNEITEGTYVLPLGRYGMQSLNDLSAVIAGS